MTKKNPKKVSIAASTLDYYMAESQAVHALCDRANVPQQIDGDSLSMSQRVAILEGVFRRTLMQVGKNPTPLH